LTRVEVEVEIEVEVKKAVFSLWVADSNEKSRNNGNFNS